MKRTCLLALVAMGVFAALPVAADNWDQFVGTGGNDSDSTNTRTELTHGTYQTHDMDDLNSGLTDDEDWYFLSIKPYTSYEVVVDATTPYMDRTAPISLTLVQADGTLDTSDYAVSSRGYSRSLRVGNNTGTVNDDRWVRVTAATDCAGLCDTRDTYNIRMMETTLYVPRFNNSGTQTSILFLSNGRDVNVDANLYFWAADGTLLNTTPITLNAHQTLVTNTSTIVPGVGGSITISHNSTYGSISGKIVALEPSTGFTFDTQVVPRAN